MNSETVRGELSTDGIDVTVRWHWPFSLLTSHLSPLTSQCHPGQQLPSGRGVQPGVGRRPAHQHLYPLLGGDWAYSFTQEWPLGGIRHQLSYTIPIEHIKGSGTGLGDVALNYRYQLAGNPEARAVVAPRLSICFRPAMRRRGAVGEL